jgi:sigma-E factor negative regulatory protein RseA
MDGELSDELVATSIIAVASNPDMKAKWERYHLIAGVIRGEGVRPGYRRIAQRVWERLDGEPTIAAPSVSSDGSSSRPGSFVGIGLAAAAAFFAVLAVPQLFDQGRAPLPAAPPVALASPPQQFLIGGSGQRWHVDKPELQHKLDRFLVNHQARSPANGIKGFIPYATVVGYEAGR